MKKRRVFLACCGLALASSIPASLRSAEAASSPPSSATSNPASASDAGVGALCTRAAIRGAWLNVRTNATGIRNQGAIAAILQDGARLEAEAETKEREILAIVEKKMG